MGGGVGLSNGCQASYGPLGHAEKKIGYLSRGGAVDCPHWFTLARSAGGFWARSWV